MISVSALVLPDVGVKAEQVLGRGIARLRKERGWTQAKLAELTDVSVTFIAALEHAKRTPSLNTIDALCAAFGVRASVLFAAGEAKATTVADRRDAIARAVAALPAENDDDAVILLRAVGQVLENQRKKALTTPSKKPRRT